MRMFGFDPGSSHAACAGLDAAAPRPRLIAARTWAVGHDEPLPEPRPYMQKQIDGTWRRSSTRAVSRACGPTAT